MEKFFFAFFFDWGSAYAVSGVTVDIGAAAYIHPINKQDVGKRLWLAAQKVAYIEPYRILSFA